MTTERTGMDNLHPAQSQETKDYLEKEMGLRPWKPTREPHYANPDRMECKYNSASIAPNIIVNVTVCRSYRQRYLPRSFVRWPYVSSQAGPAHDSIHLLHPLRPCLLLHGYSS